MADCSLCKGPLEPEGGAILFTDGRGVPFEVCGVCERMIERMRTPGDETEAAEAAEYVTEKARDIEYSGAADGFSSFLRSCEPADTSAVDDDQDEDQADEQAEEQEGESEPEAAERKAPGFHKPLLIVAAAAAALLLLAYLLGVSPF